VRYSFNADFFTQLSQEEPDAPAVPEVAQLFVEIWSLCVRSASADDLDAHLPTVQGLSVEALVELWQAWNASNRRSFLGGLAETLRAEEAGDARRGRKRLASKLRKAMELIVEAQEVQVV
jgi:hypothetical protein